MSKNELIRIENYQPKNLFDKGNTNEFRKPHIDLGEYLPEEDSSKEIVRICLSSTTGDVISIRIKSIENTFYIDIVDEYETIFSDYQKLFSLIPKQKEIFEVILNFKSKEDSQYSLLKTIEMHEFKTIKEISDFIYIDSNIYPDLNFLFLKHLSEIGYN